MLTTVNLTPEIPITLSVVIGDIIIRFGELERALITAHTRIIHADNFEAGISKNRESSSMLGAIIKRLEKDFKPYSFNWIDFDQLRRLTDARNAIIHDSIVQQADGTLTWQSNSTAAKNRRHRPVDYSELLLLREAVNRTIDQIMSGSLAAKKSIKKKKS